ncbi:MAG: DUF4105 domain-containing protein [Muribaculaceae bacterium]|nr:DUF4105 domain-containing protein [Bacteroides sp.]MDE6226752.1 DUF4105 domain-containing protein [Muribaculaceae bacterium]
MMIFIVMALSWLNMSAYDVPDRNWYDPEAANADSLTVSLLTAYPGPQVYELYGHEGIRVKGMGIDSVWNYGVFDFRAPNFIYRFVKGETDYMCTGVKTAWFLREYDLRTSTVVEQDLNLTQEEARKILELLRRDALPENRTYRYNYVKDNCATRILDRLDQGVSSPIVYPDSIPYSTFRNEMRAYNKDYPWYQLGIDIALGSGIDYPINSRESMFVPMEMMKKASQARMLDGRPLVRDSKEILEGLQDATLGPTSPLLRPLPVFILLTVLVLVVVIRDLRRMILTRWVYWLWFFLLGLVGCVVWFLIFCSSHEATSPNFLLLWFSPLQLATAVLMISRKTEKAALVMCLYNIVVVLATLLVWPFQQQSANPVFFLMMAITLMLALSFAIVIYNLIYTSRSKEYYKMHPRPWLIQLILRKKDK